MGDGDIDDDDGYDLTRVSNVLLRSMCRLPVFGKWLELLLDYSCGWVKMKEIFVFGMTDVAEGLFFGNDTVGDHLQ